MSDFSITCSPAKSANSANKEPSIFGKASCWNLSIQPERSFVGRKSTYVTQMLPHATQLDEERQVVTLSLGELEEAKPNRQLVKDYCYWFWNYR